MHLVGLLAQEVGDLLTLGLSALVGTKLLLGHLEGALVLAELHEERGSANENCVCVDKQHMIGVSLFLLTDYAFSHDHEELRAIQVFRCLGCPSTANAQ